MPTISMFYGIIVYMYFYDNKEHKTPHIHVEYNDKKLVISIPEGEILKGDFPRNKLKLLQAWIEIHQEELMANWKLAVDGNEVFKIEPLR
ncbi:MAG: DUF4160 domain-containing protein [Ignavibacteriae bacterium]|nr:DUF4160 domain-containing protein [Ignavibacteriota bacterium]